MDGRTRREGILRLLAGSDACLSASKLAERFGVTRQVIVSDIALLRANGQKILATRLGYRLERAPEQGKLASVVCRHGDRQVFDEFCAVVDNGGAVLNVIVEHPLYGEICVELNVASRYDAQAFVERMAATAAEPLCGLTGGLHVHMLRVPDDAALERIAAALDALGILAERPQEEEPAGG